MSRLAAEDRCVVAVNLSRNFGHQLAVTAGLSLCRGNRCLIIDADLQDPPELLRAMMVRMDEGYDVVYGQRLRREGETLFKRATAIYRILSRISDIDIPADTGDFRLMNRRAVEAINAMPEHHRFIRGMVSWIGMRQEAIVYVRAARSVGTSKYPLSKMIRFSIDAITGFSNRPLRLATYFGLLFSLATIAMIAFVIGIHLAGRTIPGWTSLAMIMLGIASGQFLLMGVMGEYIGRLYIEAKRRPLYVIQEIVAHPNPSQGGGVDSVAQVIPAGMSSIVVFNGGGALDRPPSPPAGRAQS